MNATLQSLPTNKQIQPFLTVGKVYEYVPWNINGAIITADNGESIIILIERLESTIDQVFQIVYNVLRGNIMKYDTTDPEFSTWVKGLLHDEVISNLRITFTKSDGTDREMLCTLLESAIPTDKIPKTTTSTPSETVQRVFDLDKQEWRSFKWSSVKTVTFDIGGK